MSPFQGPLLGWFERGQTCSKPWEVGLGVDEGILEAGKERTLPAGVSLALISMRKLVLTASMSPFPALSHSYVNSLSTHSVLGKIKDCPELMDNGRHCWIPNQSDKGLVHSGSSAVFLTH